MCVGGGVGLCEAKIEMSSCQMMKIFYHHNGKSLVQMGEAWIKCFLRNVLYFLLGGEIRNGCVMTTDALLVSYSKVWSCNGSKTRGWERRVRRRNH